MEGTEGSSAPASRLRRLQQVTSALSRAATLGEVTAVVVTTVTEELGAESVLVALLTDDATGFEIAEAVGYLPSTLEQWRTFPLDAPLPAGDAIRQQRMVVLESLDDRDRQYPALRGQPAAHEAFVIVPLLANGAQPIGIVSFGFDRAFCLRDEERSFVQALADQCAHAIHRARLYEQQRTAAHQRGFLNRAGQRLAEAATYHDVVRRVATVAVPHLGDGAVVFMRVPGGFQVAASWHVDPERRAVLHELTTRHRLSSHALVDRAFRTGRTQAVRVDEGFLREHGDGEERYQPLLGLRVHQALLVPLRPRSSSIGVLALLAGEGRSFSDEDRSLADSFAALAALHCDNARLLEQQTRIARRLQASLLPPMLPQIPGLDIAAAYAAAGTGAEVGGDFYDVFQAGAGHWFAVTGDVRGRGVDAAATTGLARHTIRAAAVPHARPSDVVRRLNEVLIATDGGDAPFPEPRFCAVCVMAVEPGPGSAHVTLCCAGHPLPRLLRANGDVSEIGVPGTVVGVVPDPDLVEVTLTVRTGDSLVLFTDGISERHTRAEFFEDGLADMLSGVSHLDADAVASGLLDEAKAFAAGHDDDMAVLVLRVGATDTGTPPPRHATGTPVGSCAPGGSLRK